MKTDEMKFNVIEGMKLLNEERVLQAAKEAIAQGKSSNELLNWLNRGMYEVGKLYEAEEYYIIELIVSEMIYTSVLELPGFCLCKESSSERLGVMVIGTVKDDHHDIGKNIFKGMAEASGILVYDLGVDVPPEEFIKAIDKYKPDILAISAILTSVEEEIKTLITLVKKQNFDKVPFIITGGSAITERTKEHVGADAFARSANEGIELCLKQLGE